jgi:hypothetical protein
MKPYVKDLDSEACRICLRDPLGPQRLHIRMRSITAQEMFAANALGIFGDLLRWQIPQPPALLRVLPRRGDRV